MKTNSICQVFVKSDGFCFTSEQGTHNFKREFLRLFSQCCAPLLALDKSVIQHSHGVT